MIAVQGEQVTRIDADTEEIATNVSGAQGYALLQPWTHSTGPFDVDVGISTASC